jgi:esterase/lipase
LSKSRINKSRIAIVALVITGVTLWFLTPARLEPAVAAVEVPADLDDWLLATEKSAAERYGLIADTEKRITWFDAQQPTAYSVLYLHGFSATRQETAPLARVVANALGANLFETRLAGHGRQRDALTAVRAEDWLDDAAEALAVASRLGQRVIVIGTSTGATLAAAMLDHPAMQAVDTLVMISPNFAPRDTKASWMTRPAGPLLARLLVGETRSWTPHNAQQARFWSTSYPMATTVEVMRLVDLANRILPTTVSQRLLMFYSLEDTVISAEAALDVFAETNAPQKTAIAVTDPGDPSSHVLAGDILSAAKTAELAATIVDFIARPAP